jgi:hypothetical protein
MFHVKHRVWVALTRDDWTARVRFSAVRGFGRARFDVIEPSVVDNVTGDPASAWASPVERPGAGFTR